MRRARGHHLLAVLFALLALNAWAQVVLVALGRSDDPPALVVLQCLIGTAAAAAAWGSWCARRWAPVAGILYGLLTAGLLVTLEPLLDLGRDARGGLWVGAAVVLLFALGTAWYLRRVARRSAHRLE